MRHTRVPLCVLPLLAGMLLAAPAAVAAPHQLSRVQPSCEGRVATIVADQGLTSETKTVTGTPGDDVIVGSEADDDIDGGAGNDVICGLGGSDTLTGGDGDDRLLGGLDHYEVIDGEDSVSGDILSPGPGDDHLDAGWDDRQLIDDWLYSGGDLLDFSGASGGITADLTAGTVIGQGSDTVVPSPVQQLFATPYDDRITGSPGDDLISALGGADVVDAGAGDDTITLDGYHFRDDLGLVATDSVSAGDGNDRVATRSGADTISTGAGEDEVIAGRKAGAVTIDTGHDDDSVSVFSGARLDGGEGRDRIQFNTKKELSGPVTLKASAGTLFDGGRLAISVPGWEHYTFDTTSGVRWRFHGSGLDETFAAYGAARIIAFGRGGDDVLHGGTGRDRLVGGAGSDRAIAYEGHDLCVRFERLRGCERTR